MDNKTISAQGKKLLIFHALFTAAISLTGGFTNIFLWRLKNDFSFLAYYNLMFVLLLLVGYVFAGYLLTLIKSKTALRIAFILCILGYSSMLLFKERIVDYILLYGIIQGIGQGIYWGIYNLSQLKETNNGNRENYFGITSGLLTLFATFTPLISGFLITYLPSVTNIDYSGYYFLYAVSISIFLVLLGYAEAMPTFVLKYFKFSDVLEITNSQKFRYMSLNELLGGFLESSSSIIYVVFSFILLTNEFRVGMFSSIFGILSACYLFILGRKINIHKRASLIFFGAGIIVVGRLIFAYMQDLSGLAIDTALSTIGNPLFGLPAASIILATIESRSHFVTEREEEYMVAREVPLGFGRFFGSLFFIIYLSIFGNYNIEMIRMWFVAVSLTLILRAILLNKINKYH